MDNYQAHKRLTYTSVKWNIFVKLISEGLIFTIGIMLMRLINPSEFGLLGMVTVVTGFLNVFKDFGLGNSLIQKKNIDKIDSSTIFWFSFFIGATLTILLIFTRSFIVKFYHEPKLNEIIIALAPLFIIGALGRTHQFILRKKLLFKKIFFIEAISIGTSGIISIYLAFKGYGVWALIILHLSRILLNTIITWFITNFFPLFKFSISRFKEHWKFGFPLLGNQIFNYITRNSDRLLIGKYLGSESLGFYSRGNNTILMPTRQIIGVIAPVLFPSFSLIKDQKTRIKQIYLKSIKISTFFIFPLMGLIIIFSKPIVSLVFGNQWIPMAPLLRILPLIGAIDSITHLSGSLFLSQGKVKTLATINIIRGIASIIVFYIGSQHSIEIVAWGLVGVFLLYMIPRLYYGGKSINCGLNEIYESILPNLFSSFISITIFIFFNNFITFPSNYLLLLWFIGFVILWLLLNIIIDKNNIISIINSLKQIK